MWMHIKRKWKGFANSLSLPCERREEASPGWFQVLTWASCSSLRQAKGGCYKNWKTIPSIQSMECLPHELSLDIISTTITFLAFPDTEMHWDSWCLAQISLARSFYFFYHSPLPNVPSLSSAVLLLLQTWFFYRMPQIHSKMKVLNRNKIFPTILPFQKC